MGSPSPSSAGQYPKGDNVVVAHDVDRTYKRTHGNLVVRFVSLQGLAQMLGP